MVSLSFWIDGCSDTKLIEPDFSVGNGKGYNIGNTVANEKYRRKIKAPCRRLPLSLDCLPISQGITVGFLSPKFSALSLPSRLYLYLLPHSPAMVIVRRHSISLWSPPAVGYITNSSSFFSFLFFLLLYWRMMGGLTVPSRSSFTLSPRWTSGKDC